MITRMTTAKHFVVGMMNAEKKLLKKYKWVVKEGEEQKAGSCADIYAENKCDLTNYFMIIDDGNVKNGLNEAVYHIYVNSFGCKIFEGIISNEKEFKNTMHTLGFEKKTKKERIEELEKRVEQLEKAIEIGMKELSKLTDPKFNRFSQPEKQAPEFWYVDIVEEKDSELLPKFKEWFLEKAEFEWLFGSNNYGWSNSPSRNGYQATDILEDFVNSDKMQKITLNEWNNWFNK